MNQQDELFKQFNEDFTKLRDDPEPIMLQLTKIQAWGVLSNLQLALRHPQNQGATSKIVRKVAEAIQEQVAKTPALAEVARRGWEPKYDW